MFYFRFVVEHPTELNESPFDALFFRTSTHRALTAESKLLRLQIRNKDISNDSILTNLYGDSIPVILLGTKEVSRLKVNGPLVRLNLENEIRCLITQVQRVHYSY